MVDAHALLDVDRHVVRDGKQGGLVRGEKQGGELVWHR